MNHRLKLKLLAATSLILFSNGLLAEVVPPKGATDSRVRIVTYDEDDVVRLKGYIGYQTHIEVAPGEKFVTLFAGDTGGIDIGQVRNNIFIKPKAELVRTNATIVTDRRLYHYDYSVSRKTKNLSRRGDMIYSLRYVYPREQALAAAAALERRQAEERFEESKKQRPRNENYWFCGDTSLKPLHAYDDGAQTHIKFPAKAEFPAMFVKNDDGSESLLNFNVDADEVVIHRVARRFVLRRGALVGCVVNKSFNGGGERLSNNVIAPGVERRTKGNIQ